MSHSLASAQSAREQEARQDPTKKALADILRKLVPATVQWPPESVDWQP